MNPILWPLILDHWRSILAALPHNPEHERLIEEYRRERREPNTTPKPLTRRVR